MFRVAAAHHVPAFTHIRKNEPEGLAEVIRDAEATGTLLHVAHIGSSAPRWVREALAMIEEARSRGVNVTTEVYPYGAGFTNLASVIFDDGWQQRMKIDHGDLQWLATGERLTAESFARYRRQGGGPVIHHSIPEATVDLAVAAPGVIIASDAGDYEEDGQWTSPQRRHVRPRPRASRPGEAGTDADAGAREDDHPAGAAPRRGEPRDEDQGPDRDRRRRGYHRVRPRAGHRSRHLRSRGLALRGHLLRARERDARGSRRNARARSLPRRGIRTPPR